MDLVAITTDVAQRIATAVDDVHVYGYVPDSPQTPCAVVELEAFQYHDTYNTGENPKCVVTFLAGSIAAEAVQQQLLTWLSTGVTNSVIDAIENGDNYRVVELRQWGTVQLQDGGTRYYSAQIVIDIFVN